MPLPILAIMLVLVVRRGVSADWCTALGAQMCHAGQNDRRWRHRLHTVRMGDRTPVVVLESGIAAVLPKVAKPTTHLGAAL